MVDMSAYAVIATPFAAILLVYVVVAIGLAFALQPLRLDLVRRGEAFLSEQRWDADQRAEINLLLDTAMSFRVGLLLPLAVIGVLIDEILKRPVECSTAERELNSDPRFDGFLLRYFVSVAGANPLAALASLGLMALGMLILIPYFGRSKLREIVEWPLLRASAGMAGPAQFSMRA